MIMKIKKKDLLVVMKISDDSRSSRIHIRYIKANSPSLALDDIPLEWYQCIGFFDNKEKITYLQEIYYIVDYSFDDNLSRIWAIWKII